jgi:hypothetical protein
VPFNGPPLANQRVPSPDEAALLATNLARTRGYRVFPCRDDKRPACPHGFKQASTDPDVIAELWRSWPGPLIGVATGAVSGIDLLDLDRKHDAACAWWQQNYHRLPLTRTFRTRGGGLHLQLIHAEGIRNSEGKLATGVDVRGDGGYLIYWFAAGCECLDHSLPAPWPRWLLDELLPKLTPSLIMVPLRPRQRGNLAGATEGVLRRIERADEGCRNSVLFWGACRLGEHIRKGEISTREAETRLLAAAQHAGLTEIEARLTIRSGLRRSA